MNKYSPDQYGVEVRSEQLQLLRNSIVSWIRVSFRVRVRVRVRVRR